MKGLIVASAGVLALMAGAAQAGERDLHGSAAIRSGDLTKAELILKTEMAGLSATPKTMLNLAHVYRHTDRSALARALYEQVMSEDNVLVSVGAERSVWSYDIARANLYRLNGSSAMMAAR